MYLLYRTSQKDEQGTMYKRHLEQHMVYGKNSVPVTSPMCTQEPINSRVWELKKNNNRVQGLLLVVLLSSWWCPILPAHPTPSKSKSKSCTAVFPKTSSCYLVTADSAHGCKFLDVSVFISFCVNIFL